MFWLHSRDFYRGDKMEDSKKVFAQILKELDEKELRGFLTSRQKIKPNKIKSL